MSRRHALAGFLAAAALGIAACGGDDQKYASDIDGDPGTPLPSTLANLTPPPDRTPETPLPKTEIVSNVSTDLSKKPELKPSGLPPDELEGLDVTPGAGPRVKKGDTVEVQYTGVLLDDGREFDTSYNADGSPGATNFKFKVGAGDVIKGWDNGVIGMRPGMRRVLVIPSDDGYGPEGSPPAIPGGATLVFGIDLKKIR